MMDVVKLQEELQEEVCKRWYYHVIPTYGETYGEEKWLASEGCPYKDTHKFLLKKTTTMYELYKECKEMKNEIERFIMKKTKYNTIIAEYVDLEPLLDEYGENHIGYQIEIGYYKNPISFPYWMQGMSIIRNYYLPCVWERKESSNNYEHDSSNESEDDEVYHSEVSRTNNNNYNSSSYGKTMMTVSDASRIYSSTSKQYGCIPKNSFASRAMSSAMKNKCY